MADKPLISTDTAKFSRKIHEKPNHVTIHVTEIN